MIDARRTRQMSKMAMYEESESVDYGQVAACDERSYIALWMVAYVVGAVAVSLVYSLIALYIIAAFCPEGISTIVWIIYGVAAGVGLVCHVYFYTGWASKRIRDKYDSCKAKCDYIEQQYKILQEMYEEQS